MNLEISQQQLEAIQAAGLIPDDAPLKALFDTSRVGALSLEELLNLLKIANATYRAGFPLIEDSVYDNVILAELQLRDPLHPFLKSVEPEPLQAGKAVLLPQKMLSTEKAYSFEAVEKWINRMLKIAQEINFDLERLDIRVTPKLDGYAAYDDGNKFYTRGDGNRGQDISRAFSRGLQIACNGQRGQGAGEIVINKDYFEIHLSDQFENSRNIQAAIIAEKKIDPAIQKAIDEGACVFHPFASLKSWTGHYSKLLQDFDSISEAIWNAVEYDVDGIILEATADAIKTKMGATRHHHRWQIAFKVNDESAEVKVLSVIPQTSRTGRVSPVVELEPTRLSGVTISRATAHHYTMVKSRGIGPGALVQLVRSGLVIPKIESVITPVEPDIAKTCPSCDSHLIWEGDHLICPNKTSCPAQTENTLVHFFKTLGNVDGFGPRVIEKLHQNGIRKIHQIYKLSQTDFAKFGFGDKTSKNLEDQLGASRSIAIEDWRFLAAFGVTRLGFGNCEKLLEHHELTELFKVSVENMVQIDGFAELSAKAIYEGLENIQDEFFKVYNLGFNLTPTVKLAEKTDNVSPLAGKLLVFTGAMLHGSRSEMEKQAKALGAKVGKSVTTKTTYLVAGERVGASKINAAREKGVEVLTEAEYLALVDQRNDTKREQQARMLLNQ